MFYMKDLPLNLTDFLTKKKNNNNPAVRGTARV